MIVNALIEKLKKVYKYELSIPIKGKRCGIIPGNVSLQFVASVAKVANAPAQRIPCGW